MKPAVSRTAPAAYQVPEITGSGANEITRGHVGSQRYLLGCVFAYQIALLYRYLEGECHQAHLKALLRSGPSMYDQASIN
jgi:hypothetical protein